ncbi:MAG: competence protein ComGC, partial [Marivirga sp.]
MAKQATTKTTKTAVDELVKILDAYKHYVLDHGHEPPSVYKFTSDLKIKESVFYNHFNSFS